MIQDKKVLAVIAARGGSKGLRRKNLRETGGKPLIAWSIEAGRGSRYIDRLVLSSDDDEIMAVAREWECDVPFRRPDGLAGDEARIEDALIHALVTIGDDFDYLVLLQATSPLRTSGDIDACLERCLETGAPAMISVSEAGKSPFWMYGLDADGRMQPLLEGRYSRRQDLPTAYAVNGAVYVAETGWFRRNSTFVSDETRAYVMPAERSVDVDAEIDMLTVEAILSSGGSKTKRTME